jgi:hypothetical protein
MHVAAGLADKLEAGPARDFMSTLDGGRRRLTTRYAKSPADWQAFFGQYGFDTVDIIPVANELLFMMQDCSLRALTPVLIEQTQAMSPHDRASLKRHVCESLLPGFIKQFYEGIEGNKNVKHAYYLLELQKA